MSKQKGIARKGADKKTVALVEDVLAMAAKNRYSVSKIFTAHNTVFGLSDAQSGCASCLTTRVSALRKWYGDTLPVDNPEAFRNKVLGDITPAQTAEQGPDAWLAEQTAARAIGEGSTDDERLAALQDIAESINSGKTTFPDEQHVQYLTGEIEETKARIAAAKNSGEPDYLDPTSPHHVAPAKGVTRYPMGENILPLDFTPSKDDALKGTIKGADGSNVKAGTYTTADGTTIAVSVGNKATIKDDLI